MKLETSVELLERVRAKQGGVSWYRLQRMIPASETTVANWKKGRSTIDRKFVARIAELLDESPEYVLLCLEHERETSAELRKIWKRLASLITSRAASIVLSGCALVGLAALSSQHVAPAQSLADSPTLRLMSHWRRWLRQRFGLQILDRRSVTAPAF